MHPSKVALSRIYNFENLFSGYKVIIKLHIGTQQDWILHENWGYFSQNLPKIG